MSAPWKPWEMFSSYDGDGVATGGAIINFIGLVVVILVAVKESIGWPLIVWGSLQAVSIFSWVMYHRARGVLKAADLAASTKSIILGRSFSVSYFFAGYFYCLYWLVCCQTGGLVNFFGNLGQKLEDKAARSYKVKNNLLDENSEGRLSMHENKGTR